MPARRLVLLLLPPLLGCAIPPMAAPVPVAPTEIHAPFGRTWESVIDAFSARNIPIKTIDRSSGFIATERLGVLDGTAEWADCGKVIYKTYVPQFAVYNVVVRGDSVRSSVKVTVIWETIDEAYNVPKTCNTKGVWELLFQESVRSRTAHQ